MLAFQKMSTIRYGTPQRFGSVILDNGSKDPDPYPNSLFRIQEFGCMNTVSAYRSQNRISFKTFELLEHCFQLSSFTVRPKTPARRKTTAPSILCTGTIPHGYFEKMKTTQKKKTFLPCYGSESAWIRTDLAVLNLDPGPGAWVFTFINKLTWFLLNFLSTYGQFFNIF
jgi:hypothetical protein